MAAPLTHGLSVAERIVALSQPEPNTGCWLWLGYVNPSGYGQMTLGRRSGQAVHRASYEAFVGPIPSGLTIDHKCRVRCCVNPDHLEHVTNRVNVLRGRTIPALYLERDRCINGHLFTARNTRMYIGARICRSCDRNRSLAYKARVHERSHS